MKAVKSDRPTFPQQHMAVSKGLITASELQVQLDNTRSAVTILLMNEPISFRISTHLKDVIGRDLVTNEFVAIFELVKNSFDAGASHVQVDFHPGRDEMFIIDDGKGMSIDDVKNKWLFVAYSAKADGTEDDPNDYRSKIRTFGRYAGSKGIGRFSCDTLGESLSLYTRSDASRTSVTRLNVDWRQFEENSLQEFESVKANIVENAKFPTPPTAVIPAGTATVLHITGLRHVWDEPTLRSLRSYLAKLIDPFGTTDHVEVSTYLSGDLPSAGDVNGSINNDIADILRDKTSRIRVEISDNEIVSTLVDRGRLIYKISEPNPYSGLRGALVSGEVFFLNRSAKHTFSVRMKVPPVEFGSLFLFLNGFRVFPIGEEYDDTFGLNRRKQQGSARYLGTRDILGRIDLTAPPRMFREASSRDAGLIEDARTRDLYDAIRRQMIFRLERYVVGVNWKDKSDQMRDTPEGLESDPAKLRILEIIGSFSRAKDVKIIDFDKNIVELADAREEATQKALRDLATIAEREGDEGLLRRIEATRTRIADLEKSELDARQEARKLAEERARSDVIIGQLVRQARYLSASQDLDAERIQLLLHQVSIYSGHIQSGTERALLTAGKSIAMLSNIDDWEDDDIVDAAGAIRHSIRLIMDDLSYIRLENERLQSVSRFAPNIKVDLDTSLVQGDIVGFLDEYFDVMMSDPGKSPRAEFVAGDVTFERSFSPFDMAVIADNLVDNARKARAQKITFTAKKIPAKKGIFISVSDDGVGFDSHLIDAAYIFDKHYTGHVGGTGLGLYHVSQVLRDMGGTIELDPAGEPGRADFLITIPEAE